ncbi:MAG: YlmC/YmxH family sporulation protein, partial [Clostridia bacterium]
MNIEFNELKMKEVVNILNGKRLGRVCNLVIDCEVGQIRGIIVPGSKGLSFFKGADDIYIPWKNIKKIGDDIIMVELIMNDECCRPSENAKACAIPPKDQQNGIGG